MSEFLGENAGASERVKPAPEPLKAIPPGKPPEFPKARERKSPDEKREAELAGLAKDFRAGITQLGQATDRLTRQKALERLTPQKLTELRKHSPSLARILEREIKTVTEFAKAAPDIKHTATVTRSFRDRAERVIEQRLPQLYATILKAERLATTPQPAKVAIPLKPGAPIEALVKAARAIRAGRLPFLPLETRKKAQALIDRIFARPRSLETARSPDGERRGFIERHSLIPLAVRNEIMRDALQRSAGTTPPQPARPADRQLLRTVNEIIKERTSKIEKSTEKQAAPLPQTVGAREMPQAPRAVPSFASQGAAAGGDYMAHTGEDLHVITRNDRPLVEPHERDTPDAPSVAPAAASTARAQASTRRGVPVPPAPAAAAPAPRAPTARPAQGASGGASLEGPVGGESTMKMEGTLRIPGLEDWMAKIEGRTKK
jgi:hypothetical protein